MLKAAENSYLVFKEDSFVTDYIKLGTFVGLESEKPLQALMNGFGTIDGENILKNKILLCAFLTTF